MSAERVRDNPVTQPDGPHRLRRTLFALLGYRLWWALQTPWARAQSDMACIVIGGAPRSGTTLLRSALGRHRLICSGPETTVFLSRISSPKDIAERMGWDAAEIARWQCESPSQMAFIETFARAAMQRAGKSVWAEKTPHNVWRFAFVRRRFPDAKLVHIIRDGRDVVCSLRREPFSKVKNAAWNSASAAEQCAMQWRVSVAAGLRSRGDPNYHELRYEDLVRDPEGELRRLLAFLGLPWDDAVLQPESSGAKDEYEAKASGSVFSSSIGRWRHDLSEADIDAVRKVTEPLLRALGYEEVESRRS